MYVNKYKTDIRALIFKGILEIKINSRQCALTIKSFVVFLAFSPRNLSIYFQSYLSPPLRKRKRLRRASQVKHPIRSTCTHGCSVTFFRNSGSRSFPFPQQCQLLQSISFRWNGEFEFRSIHGRGTCVCSFMDGTRWIYLFVPRLSSRKSCLPRYHPLPLLYLFNRS